MLDSLDAAAVRRWCAAGLDALRRHQREIDELNVYPVPDGDTGTNLVLTFTSALQALGPDQSGLDQGGTAGGETPHGRALRVMARGALLGARGNSGVIVAQLLKGLADSLADLPVVRGRELAGALRRAATAAYGAVAQPVEGTVLTVAVACASGAETAGSDDLAAVTRAACAAASDALAHTPEQLPALARAGVVDAGGRGLVVLLGALLETVTGEAFEPESEAEPDPASGVDSGPASARHPARPPLVAAREAGSDEYAYEVQYLLDATEAAVAGLRAQLGGLGDSLVVVGAGDPDANGRQTWNVHVHVNDVGAAIEAGVSAGRPYRIGVTRFADAEPARPGPRPAEPTPRPAEPAGRAVVVVAPGDGLAELFRGEGAAVVGGTPSTVEILRAVRGTGAAQVVVLPNDPNSHGVAVASAGEAREDGLVVRVVPTRCPVQALAALAVRDPDRPFDDDVIAMAEAAGACRYAEVTTASRQALTVAGPCQPGDVIALVDGEVNLIGTDLAATCRDLLDRMLTASGELVTLLLGAQAPDGLADQLTAHVAAAWPFVEVHVFRGGQPHYPLLVGVE